MYLINQCLLHSTALQGVQSAVISTHLRLQRHDLKSPSRATGSFKLSELTTEKRNPSKTGFINGGWHHGKYKQPILGETSGCGSISAWHAKPPFLWVQWDPPSRTDNALLSYLTSYVSSSLALSCQRNCGFARWFPFFKFHWIPSVELISQAWDTHDIFCYPSMLSDMSDCRWPIGIQWRSSEMVVVWVPDLAEQDIITGFQSMGVYPQLIQVIGPFW